MKTNINTSSLTTGRYKIILTFAAVLFALAPVVIKMMVEQDYSTEVFAPGAISFCNVLFVGNFCAGLIALAFYSLKNIIKEVHNLPRKTKYFLATMTITSTIYPALQFTALEHTSVINFVLISRFNGILYIILATFALGISISRNEVIGYTIIGITVISLLIYTNKGLHFAKGDWLLLCSALFFAVNDILVNKISEKCSIPTYVFCRNFTSAIIFFIIANILIGPEHFADAFGRNFWLLMVVYAGFAIVLAQTLWKFSVNKVPATFIGNVSLLNPVFSLSFAYLLLKEVPSFSELIAIIVIALCIIIPKLLQKKGEPTKPMSPLSIDTSLAGK
ncbi:DMT family transporter [Legionella sp. W05-934-2]|uniref:DMT family transporter n=1 Tax=Legionella sp. W05-934-2 TaxID=1198649 RepID=UPI00346274C1